MKGKKISKPVIGITAGDTAGVGPEIIGKILDNPAVYKICIPVVIGDLNLKFPPRSARAGRYAMQWVRQAVEMALAGNIQAIVTAPLCKEGIYRAGYKFEGHTDYLAYLTGAREYSMMLVSPRIRVVLVTIHTRLRDVVKKITRQGVKRAIRHAHLGARMLGITRPRIAVCALNPHGGETGDEEKKIICPAIKQIKDIKVFGPYPADTLFYRVLQKEFDVVVAMYHDQGLIPLKMMDFREGVNITLGLPVIRTSPDHGTAYDIAGKNKADPTSMFRAVQAAARMANEKEKMAR